jgi:hypothetical protein
MNDYFDRLEADLRRAAARPGPRLGPSLGWGVGALAAAVSVAAAAMVAVVVLGGGGPEEATIREGPRPTQLPGRVVARGRTPVAGPWHMHAFRTRGKHCLGIVLTRPSPALRIAASSYCGAFPRTPGFSRSELQVSPRPKARERILFGRAPERANAVVVNAREGRTIRAKLYEGPKGVRGDFYLRVIPLDLVGRVNWLDGGGRPGSRGIRVRP